MFDWNEMLNWWLPGCNSIDQFRVIKFQMSIKYEHHGLSSNKVKPKVGCSTTYMHELSIWRHKFMYLGKTQLISNIYTFTAMHLVKCILSMSLVP